LQIPVNETPIPTEFSHSNFGTVVCPADPALQPAEMGEAFELIGVLSPGAQGMRISDQVEQLDPPLPWQMNKAALMLLDA